jgi:hypothetical protein
MECVLNGANLVNTQSLAGGAEWEIHRPLKCKRWQPSNKEFFFTGRVAFRKLEKIVNELSRTTDDSLNVVVVLLPQDLNIREIRYTEASTIFLCNGHDSNKAAPVSISNGQPFGVAIDIIPKRSRTRLVTEFTDQLFAADRSCKNVANGNRQK